MAEKLQSHADNRTSIIDGIHEIASRVPGSSVLPASRLVGEEQAVDRVPFIAKIDIEDGEAEQFSRDTGWVDLFAVLSVERHGGLLPRAGRSAQLPALHRREGPGLRLAGGERISIVHHSP